MNASKIALVIALGSALDPLANSQTTLGWKSWSLGETKIVVELPDNLVRQPSKQVPGVGSMTVFEGNLKEPEISYSIAFCDRPLTGVFDYKGWQRDVEAVVLGQEGRTTSGPIPVPTPGLQSAFVGGDRRLPGGVTYTTIVGVIGTPNHLVMLSLSYDASRAQGLAITKRILDSFRKEAGK